MKKIFLALLLILGLALPVQAQFLFSGGSAGTGANLTSIDALTFADVSIIELTGVGGSAVVTSGGANRLYGSNADNTATEFKSTLPGLTIIGDTASKAACYDANKILVACTNLTDVTPLVTGTPALGAATATSLMATGRVDGTVGTLTSTAASPTTIVVATHGNASYFWNIGDSAANSIFTLPTAAAGLQYCAKNYTGITTVLKFQTSAAGQYIDLFGVNTASGGLIKTAGAAGDGMCVVGVDATHWVAYCSYGTCTKD